MSHFVRRISRCDTEMSEKLRKVISYATIAIVVLAVILLIGYWMSVDHCFDRGGRWNYGELRCEGARY